MEHNTIKNKAMTYKYLNIISSLNEPHYEKNNHIVSEQVRHKPSSTSTEDKYRDIEKEELYYTIRVAKTKSG